jgi:hypothetical protein
MLACRLHYTAQVKAVSPHSPWASMSTPQSSSARHAAEEAWVAATISAVLPPLSRASGSQPERRSNSTISGVSCGTDPHCCVPVTPVSSVVRTAAKAPGTIVPGTDLDSRALCNIEALSLLIALASAPASRSTLIASTLAK